MTGTDMEKSIRVCGIEPESIVDGPGFRYALLCRAARITAKAATIRNPGHLTAARR